MTIPAPSAFLAHRGKTILDGSVYDSFEEFYADLGETYRQVVRGFSEAGCRYLQLDEVYMIVLVDPKQRQFFAEHGNDVENTLFVIEAAHIVVSRSIGNSGSRLRRPNAALHTSRA